MSGDWPNHRFAHRTRQRFEQVEAERRVQIKERLTVAALTEQEEWQAPRQILDDEASCEPVTYRGFVVVPKPSPVTSWLERTWIRFTSWLSSRLP